MEKLDLSFLAKTALFKNIPPQEIEVRMGCLGGVVRSFPKGTYIHYAGDIVHTVSMVLKGKVIIENDDVWGNRNLLGAIGPGELFAEAYACAENEPLLINVLAAEDTTVLMMDLRKVFHTCSRSCPQHQQISDNLLHMLAKKNLALSRRILHTSSKSIRGRVLSYLSFLAAQQKKKIITVPFNRQQMADYLSVDRSALSNELSKMQKEGILEYHKESFKLLKEEE
ncbi:MAG: Crp/Fnr family transcriptional regulator [Acidaminococcus sp.]|uniref:Crp/Fnr family transcriptional regulator n=1 Tax=Acidaminococcus sp. TaxID=1872103 RepID=UPI003F13A3BD